jgi:hypothetical protein
MILLAGGAEKKGNNYSDNNQNCYPEKSQNFKTISLVDYLLCPVQYSARINPFPKYLLFAKSLKKALTKGFFA